MTTQEAKKQKWLDSEIGQAFKRDMIDNPGKMSMLVYSTNGDRRKLEYLFRTWDAFVAKLPFSDIDSRFGVDFVTWKDDE